MAKKDWMVIESELDEDQIRVLMATLDKSCIVSGCAGSGKSVLALIKAQRIQKEKGNNYNIIVFTKALCRYMNAGREMLGLNKDFFYHWEWKKRHGCPSANYIIVDEIQDFSREEIEEFITSTNNNFFFFGDSAQSIYGGLKETFPVENIRDLLPQDRKPKTFDLYRNYRLPKTVARIVQYVGIDLDGYDENIYKSIETSIPRFIQYRTFEEQIRTISEIIKKRSLSDVGILVPNNNSVMQVNNLLSGFKLNNELKYDNKEDWRNSVDNLNFNTTNPKIMTYHSAKGLQFETVFLPGIVDLTTNYERQISEQKALYVAMTRTYRDLYVMYSGKLPYPLSEVPPELYKTSEIDEIEDF